MKNSAHLSIDFFDIIKHSSDNRIILVGRGQREFTKGRKSLRREVRTAGTSNTTKQDGHPFITTGHTEGTELLLSYRNMAIAD